MLFPFGVGLDKMRNKKDWPGVVLLIWLCAIVAVSASAARSDQAKKDTAKCHPSYFECNNGVCIKGNLKCNHVNDCGDESDEINCAVKTAPTSCADQDHLCKNPPMCISIDDLCSDFNQCWDYDAIDRLCPITCQPHKFKCHNVSQCVLQKHICDGSRDCMDGSDELRCDDQEYKCEEEADSFQCDDKSACIFASDVCDGHKLCDDGSDEKNDCYNLCKTKNCGPNQLCLPEGQGVKCVCEDGYRLDKDNSCVERNHCNVSDIDRPCSQLCEEGLFGRGPQCRCIYGYSLDRDGTSCKALGSAPRLYVASASAIQYWRFETKTLSTLLDGLKGVRGLAVDSHGQRIFWSVDGGRGQPEVFAMNIEEGEKTITSIASFVLRKPEGLAYDYITKNLYVVDSGVPAILTCELHQQHCVTTFNSSTVSAPKDIVLDPSNGMLYYTDLGSKPAIMRGSMDGSSADVLVSTNLHRPKSLHLDHTTNRLYWIDSLYSSGGHVFKVDLDGTNKKPVLTHKITTPSLLSIFEGSLYWVSDQSKSIKVADKFSGDKTQTVFQYDDYPRALAMDHESLQNEFVINRCLSKNCHLCLLNNQSSGTCFCVRGYRPAHTQQYCEQVEAPSFLLMSGENQILRISLNATGQPKPSPIKTDKMRQVNALAYLPKSHSILYTCMMESDDSSNGDTNTNNANGVRGRTTTTSTTTTSIQMIPQIDDSWSSYRSVRVLNANSVISTAADEAASLVFWTDDEKRSIRVASLDGTAFNTTLPINAARPTALCVDPAGGSLYFSDNGGRDGGGVFIKRCRLDGRSCHILVSGRLRFPNHLVAQGQQLYWSDYDLGEISVVDQWGDDRETIVVTQGSPLSFGIDGGILYWIEDGEKSILFKHLHHEGSFEGKILTDIVPHDLIAVAPHTLPETACTHRNGGCEQICISIERSTKTTCLCSEGFHLHKDQKQCVKNDDDDKCDGGGADGRHLCIWENVCLNPSQVCDRVADCLDGSDETEAVCLSKMTNSADNNYCSGDEFQCTNGKCIDNDFKCDGDDDCKDGSDEKPDLCGGPQDCDPSKNHACDGGAKCFPSSYVCDNMEDCDDGSDEADCAHCEEEDELSCGEGKNECVPRQWMCDGDPDCSDGLDEHGCKPEVCNENEFTCTSDGECIDASEKCDGFIRCKNGEDEEGCPPIEGACHESEYACSDGDCIHMSAKCDDFDDCYDGEDEEECGDSCKEEEFQCRSSGKCISYGLFCDRKNDCEDGSDEVSFCVPSVKDNVNTTQLSLGSTKCRGFTCGNGRCLDSDKRCDGTADCIDNTDEVNCIASCKNYHTCSQICLDDSAGGVRCGCEPGYRLKEDGIACEDVDECINQNGGCSQKCVNVKGHHASVKGFGFKCQCLNGFARGQDYYSCKAKGGRPDLFITTRRDIKKISSDGHLKRESVVEKTGPYVFTAVVDGHRGSVFWLELDLIEGGMHIHRSDNKDKSKEENGKDFRIPNAGSWLSSYPIDIDVDWITGNLYLLHSRAHGITVLKRIDDGGLQVINGRTLVSVVNFGATIEPIFLLLHPLKRVMFVLVSQRDAGDKLVYRISLDGRQRAVMQEASRHLTLHRLPILTLDTSTDRLYWTSPGDRVIHSITIDDQDHMFHILESSVHGLRSFVVFESVAYLVKHSTVVSHPLHKGGKQGFTTIALMDRPHNIDIYHPLLQPVVPNPCDQKQCMYACVLSEEEEACCMCPLGVTPDHSNKNCEGAEVPLSDIVENKAEAMGTLNPTPTTTPSTITSTKMRQLPLHHNNTPRKNQQLQPQSRTTTTTSSTSSTPLEKKEQPQSSNPQHSDATAAVTPGATQNNMDAGSEPGLVFLPRPCSLCLNGGSCILKSRAQLCKCPDEFKGTRCESRKKQAKKEAEDDDGNSAALIAGLVVGLALLVFVAVLAVWYFKYKRHQRNLTSSIRFQKQNKFVVCRQEDKDGLVPEISFGNPGFQDEIDEEAHMQEDQDWWKKLLSRSKRTVDSAFYGSGKGGKNNGGGGTAIPEYDDHHHTTMIGGRARGDPQDPVMSDTVRLLK